VSLCRVKAARYRAGHFIPFLILRVFREHA
jgi:hypothetical protein